MKNVMQDLFMVAGPLVSTVGAHAQAITSSAGGTVSVYFSPNGPPVPDGDDPQISVIEV